MLGQGPQVPSIEVQRFVQSAFSMASFFFKSFCALKLEKWRLINELLLKNSTIDGYAY